MEGRLSKFMPSKNEKIPQELVPEESEECTPADVAIKSNKGTVNVGGTNQNTFQDCQNFSVVLHSAEKNEDSRRKSSQPKFSIKAIHQLQESVRLLYTSEEAWLVPFPWMTTRSPVSDDYYIYMDIDELDRSGRKLSRREVPLESILEAQDKNLHRAPRRVLLQAEAGFGKSTTCTKIAFDWANKINSSFFKFDLVILVRLRTLTVPLEDYVCQFCCSASQIPLTYDQIKTILLEMGANLLLLLDGMDETSEEAMESVKRVVGFRRGSWKQSFLRGATILMTSRPSCVSTVTTFIERNVRIMGMPVLTRNLFVQRFFKDQEDANQILLLLDRIEFRWNISPLLLFFICYLKEEGQLQSLQSESKIIESLLNFLGKSYVARENLAWTTQNIELQFGEFGKLCFELLKSGKTCLKRYEILGGSACPIEFITGCGILKKQIGFHTTPMDSDVYEPVHKGFVEHLAAIYLQQCCDKLSDPQRKVLFVASVIRPPFGVFNKIIVYDSNETKQICIHSCVIKGSIDVIITKDRSQGVTELDVKFVLCQEAASVLQTWRDYQTPVSFQASVLLSIGNRDSGKTELHSIPIQFRPEIGMILGYYGHIVCDYKLFSECGCSLDTNMFPANEEQLGKLFHIGYNEVSKQCSTCSFANKPALVEMLLRAENLTKGLNFQMASIEIQEFKDIFAEYLLGRDVFNSSLNMSLIYDGSADGVQVVLESALSCIGFFTDSNSMEMFETHGEFLTWLLNRFGIGKKTTEKNTVGVTIPLTLSVDKNGLVHNFSKKCSGKTSYSFKKGSVEKKGSYLSMKKLVTTWKNDKELLKDSLLNVTFFDNSQVTTCTVSVFSGVARLESNNNITWTNLKF